GPNPLQSQDSLISTSDGHFLLAVNAGSNELSVLSVTQDGLQFVDKVSSDGIYPVSVACHRNLIYVLNEGRNPNLFSSVGTPNITGFFLDFNGKLHEIRNSRITAELNADPADLVFSPDGDLLVVSEKVA